jgi:putative oxidoreductase
MKIAAIIVRTLMGLLFLFGSIAFFAKLFPEPELQGNMKTFNDGLKAAGYFLPLLKVIELLCGIAFVTGRFVPLALVVIAPVIVNILFVHTFLEPSGLPIAVLLVLGNIFLAFYYRERFAAVLEMK